MVRDTASKIIRIFQSLVWVEGRGGGGRVGHTMSHLARVLTILLCQHACIVLLPVILIFFHMSSLRE